LPSSYEWDVLEIAVGGSSLAGTKLKATSGWDYDYSSGNGTDDYGFSALPGGFWNGSIFDNTCKDAFLWSSSEVDSDNAIGYGIRLSSEELWHRSSNKSLAFSVRCVKD
jgi:uncharacterized protein (TIGR02145 family)